ncbi:hypothetical protein TVAG_304260 [Trichomonas vaginalis G3]|uniref:Importin N-terminal domain-containing protein n=1 Tax=Trichomonas vaginalis (strain ATCC PRA-98 / G3) TaxID=412133 RepID=A2FGR0_TRIV3|nr:armadillo (ARM) repeat-containing protein family [Trichomonas vaginalis G3]EAX95896.1 hypothetical protein TVAG_304260 [Trichomonas vaginalis G3]KAI5551220.1 armadillo (ARM) repeat-containing protein family [Trichomonas vaginalis G3]|eukprot:XP_001308826.1 hypothetical protein [Trichomonas vaginalis G3]
MDVFSFVKDHLEKMSSGEFVQEATDGLDLELIQNSQAEVAEILMNIIFSNEAELLRKHALFYVQYLIRSQWENINENIRNFIKSSFLEHYQLKVDPEIMKNVPEFSKRLIYASFTNEGWPEFFDAIQLFLNTEELAIKGLIIARSYILNDTNPEFVEYLIKYLLSLQTDNLQIIQLAIDLFSDILDKNQELALLEMGNFYNNFIKIHYESLSRNEISSVLRFMIILTAKSTEFSSEIAEYVFSYIFGDEWSQFSQDFKCRLLNIYSNLLNNADLALQIIDIERLLNLALLEFNVTPEMFNGDPCEFVNNVDEIGPDFETTKLSIHSLIKKITKLYCDGDVIKNLYDIMLSQAENYPLFTILQILSQIEPTKIIPSYYIDIFKSYSSSDDFTIHAAVYMFISSSNDLKLPIEMCMEMYKAMQEDESRLVQYYAAICASKYLFKTEEFKSQVDYNDFIFLFGQMSDLGSEFGSQDILESLYYLVESCGMNSNMPCNIIDLGFYFLNSIDVSKFNVNEAIPFFSFQTIIKASSKFEGEEDIAKMQEFALKLLSVAQDLAAVEANGNQFEELITTLLLLDAFYDVIYYTNYSNIFWEVIDAILDFAKYKSALENVCKILECMIFKANEAFQDYTQKIYVFILSTLNEDTIQSMAPLLTAFLMKVPDSLNPNEIAEIILGNEINISSDLAKAISLQINDDEIKAKLLELSAFDMDEDFEDDDMESDHHIKWFSEE